MYLDSAYIAKYYVNEPDAAAVRKLISRATDVCSSSWALIEVTCVFHRHVREGALSLAQGHELIDLFRAHVDAGLWSLTALSEAILRSTATLIRSLPKAIPVRARDAIHLATALNLGEPGIWTNDRRLLAAATHVGLAALSI